MSEALASQAEQPQTTVGFFTVAGRAHRAPAEKAPARPVTRRPAERPGAGRRPMVAAASRVPARGESSPLIPGGVDLHLDGDDDEGGTSAIRA